MNKASLFSAPPLRAVPPVNDTRLSQCVFSAIARKKLPFQGAFFMRYCFRTKRLQQKRGWRDGRNFPHHTATVARVRASLAWLRIRGNTRWGWGAGRRGLLPPWQPLYGGRRSYPLRRKKPGASTAGGRASPSPRTPLRPFLSGVPRYRSGPVRPPPFPQRPAA